MSRARPMVKEGSAFQFYVDGEDVVYGPTRRRRLSAIDSRHKAAWLWTMIWQESDHPERDEALDLIDRHGRALDDAKSDRDSWLLILDDMIAKKGLLISKSGRPEPQFRVAQWGGGETIPIPPPPAWEGAEFMEGGVELVLAYCCNIHPGGGPLCISELLPLAEQRDKSAARLLEDQFIKPSVRSL